MKIKITDLKRQLKEFEQKELIDLIVEMFKNSKEVQNFLSSKFLGEDVIKDLFKKAQKKIKNEFFPDRGEPKLRLAEARNAINEFTNATKDEVRAVDLMIYYVELGVKFTNSYGDIFDHFYSSMVKMFDQVAMKCDRDEELYKKYAKRLHNVISSAEGTGWGFYEDLLDSYYMIEWVQEDEDDE